MYLFIIFELLCDADSYLIYGHLVSHSDNRCNEIFRRIYVLIVWVGEYDCILALVQYGSR